MKDNDEPIDPDAHLARLDKDALDRVGVLDPIEAAWFLSLLDDIEMVEAGHSDSGPSFCAWSNLLEEIDKLPVPSKARDYLRERATCAPDAPCRVDGTHAELVELGRLPEWLR